MRIVNNNYRNDRRFVLQRLDRAAAHVNAFLTVIAIALGVLDLTYAAHKIATGWHPITVAAVKAHTSPIAR